MEFYRSHNKKFSTLLVLLYLCWICLNHVTLNIHKHTLALIQRQIYSMRLISLIQMSCFDIRIIYQLYGITQCACDDNPCVDHQSIVWTVNMSSLKYIFIWIHTHVILSKYRVRNGPIDILTYLIEANSSQVWSANPPVPICY